MQVIQSFEISITVYQLIWCNIPHVFNIQQHSYENLKSLMILHIVILFSSFIALSCYELLIIILLLPPAPHLLHNIGQA